MRKTAASLLDRAGRRMAAAGLAVALSLGGAVAASGEARPAADPSTDLLLANATIVDGRGGAPFAGSVLVRGGRIARVCPAPRRCAPEGTRTIDLTGRFLIPGLIDSHVHVATDPQGGDRDAPARLAAAFRLGVTSVRDMAGDARALAALAARAETADQPVPRLSYAALFGGPAFFEDPRTRTASVGFAAGQAPWQRAVTASTGPAELRDMVAAARASGAGAIKLYADLDGPTAARIVAEAHRQHLRVWSHAATFPARPGELAAAGVDSLSHSLLLGYEVAPAMPESYHRRGAPLELSAASVDDPRILALLRTMRERGIVLDATLDVARRLEGAPPGAAGFAAPAAAAQWAYAVTRRALAAGITVSAGSDSRLNLPDALHVELEVLVRNGGLTPMQALVAATSGGAAALGRARELGTIERGRIADLVVLRADPTRDIRAVREVELVIKGGAVHDMRPRAGIAALLARIRTLG